MIIAAIAATLQIKVAAGMWRHRIADMEREGGGFEPEPFRRPLNVKKTQSPSSPLWRVGGAGGVMGRRQECSVSVTGSTPENEMFPKIKGRSRRGREENVLNRLKYKENGGLSASHAPPPFQKPLDSSRNTPN